MSNIGNKILVSDVWNIINMFPANIQYGLCHKNCFPGGKYDDK